jgi:MoaA/NifB/PqqE/SkfB family radical SAM enzyme
MEAYLGEKVLQQGLNYLARDPEKNLPLLIDWAERLARQDKHKQQIRTARKWLIDPDSNWHKLARRVLREVQPKSRECLVRNFLINSWFYGIPRQREVSDREGVNVPYTILIDPTARCNLHCTGCWAGDYDQRPELDLETLDRILGEARELGIYFIVYSGGEPLLRASDLLALARKYNDMAFHAYTNGTLVTEDLVRQLAEVGNFTLAFSVEGLREATDARRGRGVFDRVMHAMDLMRAAGLIFGFSATYTRKNTEEIASDAFIDLMIEKGCLFGWLFTYVPVGKDVDTELMATPEQRALMYRKVQEWRQTKPIAVFDFWNDGELTQGCIAGGRRYFHINAAGEIEPCAFIHYANGNIKEMSLKEALRSPIFQAYQKRQPFNNNMLQPCPLIDNPLALAEIVRESGAHPTQVHAIDALETAEALLECAENWGRQAQILAGGRAQAEASGS